RSDSTRSHAASSAFTYRPYIVPSPPSKCVFSPRRRGWREKCLLFRTNGGASLENWLECPVVYILFSFISFITRGAGGCYAGITEVTRSLPTGRPGQGDRGGPDRRRQRPS